MWGAPICFPWPASIGSRRFQELKQVPQDYMFMLPVKNVMFNLSFSTFTSYSCLVACLKCSLKFHCVTYILNMAWLDYFCSPHFTSITMISCISELPLKKLCSCAVYVQIHFKIAVEDQIQICCSSYLINSFSKHIFIHT